MEESPASALTRWRLRLKQIYSQRQRAYPFLSGACAALLILLLNGLLDPPPPTQLTTRDVENSIAQAMASATPRPAPSALVYDIIRPSLVFIETNPAIEGLVRAVPTAVPSGDFHLLQTASGVGTGVIVNDMGAILTSLHVVAAANTIQVTFADGTVARAEIVGTLSDNDIAVLQTDILPEMLIPATLGNPNAIRIGEEAFVVDHPFSLYGSMSAGVISGLNRTYQPPNSAEPMTDLIQVDAATNPGASGGPLLNRYGQVVGIVTALLNPTGQEVFIGIGFAVPITTAGGAAGLPPQ